MGDTPGAEEEGPRARSGGGAWRARPSAGRALGVLRGSLDRRAGGAETGGLAQGVGLVGPLPREVVVLAPEVAVGGRLLVDRAVQAQRLAEGAGAQVEVLVDERLDLRAA